MKESFYFGTDDRLFGTYHAPPLREDRRCGIVFCYPIGQEHIRSYRLFQQLAEQVSSLGYHVLRFDYFATGDSIGTNEEGYPVQWQDDILQAVEELKNSGDVDKISLIGLRFGASLAALAGSGLGKVHSIVLWEPVIRGEDYLRELKMMHQSWLEKQLFKPAASETGADEILGFSMPEKMTAEIGEIDLTQITKLPAQNSLILGNEHNEQYAMFADYLQKLGSNSEYRYIGEQQVWYKDERLDNFLVPKKSLDAIVSWLSKVCS